MYGVQLHCYTRLMANAFAFVFGPVVVSMQ